MQSFEIAGISLDVNCDFPEIYNLFEKFRISNNNPDLQINISKVINLELPKCDLIMDGNLKWYKSIPSGFYYITFSTIDSLKVKSILKVNTEWSYAEIFYKVNVREKAYPYIKAILEILFRNLILLKHGFVIHASAIKWQDKGIIFTAPSGTGKSTQSNLWKDSKNALILNDDRPAISFKNSIPIVSGTPWSGFNSVYENNSAPISAIIALEQSDINQIMPLQKSTSVLKLLPRCFLPYYDNNMMDIAIKNLEDVIEAAPVYHLKCRPDEEAVEMVLKCLK